MVLDFAVGTGGKSGFGLQPWPRQFVIKVNDTLPLGWRWTLKGIQSEQAFTMRLGEERQVKLDILVPDDAAPNAGGAIDIQQIDIATNKVVGGVNFNLYEDHHAPQTIRAVSGSLIDGQVVLTWQPVIKEENTNLRERVSFYEVTRNGQLVGKVLRDQDPDKVGMQWTDKERDGDARYTIVVVDEGGNRSAVSPQIYMPSQGDGLFNWFTWLLIILLLFVIFFRR